MTIIHSKGKYTIFWGTRPIFYMVITWLKFEKVRYLGIKLVDEDVSCHDFVNYYSFLARTRRGRWNRDRKNSYYQFDVFFRN